MASTGRQIVELEERVDALEEGASPGGSSSPVNWCVINVAQATPAPLTPGAATYHYAEEDLSIQGQSGTDFSIGTHQTHGAVFSASGGVFQVCPIANCAPNATLDGGSTTQRWLSAFGLAGPSRVGPGGLANGTGFDALWPVLVGGDPSVTFVSGPGYVQPGEPTLCNFAIELVGGSGTDSVPLDQAVFSAVIWQTGLLT